MGEQETFDDFAEDTGGHYGKCCVREWSGGARGIREVNAWPEGPHYRCICRERGGLRSDIRVLFVFWR